MKNRILIIIILIFSAQAADAQALKPSSTSLSHEKHCTIIYAYNGRTVLAGNNEDWINPFPIIWFQPAKDGKFGYMGFGFQSGWPKMEDYQWEGAVNEKGLFYDYATTEEVKVPRDPNKSDCWWLSGKIIEECSTVDEAIQVFSEYNFKDGVWKGHYMIGDRFGNSAIIEPLGVIRREHSYQIATNFLLSRTDPETSNDPRYRLALKWFEQADQISLDLFRRILADTHMETFNGSSGTLYSYIHDLKKGDVYIYNFHDYDQVVKLNIHDELKKGEHVMLISSIFPNENFAAQNYRATYVTTEMLRKALQNGVTGEDGAIAFLKLLNAPDPNPARYQLGEEYLIAGGNALIQYNKLNEAVELFKYIVEEFPQSANAYDSLGDAYRKAGQTDLAIESFRKSLQLNPNNNTVRDKLKELYKNH